MPLLSKAPRRKVIGELLNTVPEGENLRKLAKHLKTPKRSRTRAKPKNKRRRSGMATRIRVRA